MRSYARPLSMARVVLDNLHLRAAGDVVGQEARTTLPFFIDMNRLFEAWVGVCLEAANADPAGQVKQSINLLPNISPINIRPDFLCPGRGDQMMSIVVDAKYKLGPLEQSDIYQALAYGRLVNGYMPGLGAQECWLAVPDAGGWHGGIQEALNEFSHRWQGRCTDGNPFYQWPRDGFRFGVIRVPWPTPIAH